MTGPYWFGYWIFLICNGILPQVLWIDKLKELKAIRIIVALFILFTFHIEKAIILITSFHRDYVPSSWTMTPSYAQALLVLYDALVNAAAFVIVLSGVHFVKSRLAARFKESEMGSKT
jgi:hypothetical protein